MLVCTLNCFMVASSMGIIQLKMTTTTTNQLAPRLIKVIKTNKSDTIVSVGYFMQVKVSKMIQTKNSYVSSLKEKCTRIIEVLLNSSFTWCYMGTLKSMCNIKQCVLHYKTTMFIMSHFVKSQVNCSFFKISVKMDHF